MGQTACCSSETEDPSLFDTGALKNISDAPVAEVPGPVGEAKPEDEKVAEADDDMNDEQKNDEEPNTADTIYSKAEDNIGDHICPVTGEEATEAFVKAGLLKKLLEASQEDLGKNFSLDRESLADTQSGAGGIAMAVSDPTAEDCPLVFVSNGFEDLTGYTTASVVGRSCRFLQPTSKIVNDAVNLNERKLMRTFCNEDQPTGETIVNLLLNERITGERFWNLLRMQYVSVDGAKYIFGVQTTVDAFMPKTMIKRCNDPAKNQKIVAGISEFTYALENLRNEIRGRKFTPMLELKGYYTCAVNTLQTLPLFKSLTPKETETRSRTKSTSDDLQPGCTVMAKDAIKYANYEVPKKTEGNVMTIDGFGNATIEWKGVGKRILLRRDFGKLQITATEIENQLRHASAQCHPNWTRLEDLLRLRAGSDEADGIASNYDREARQEIAGKLISNHQAVIADVTNPSPKLNIEAKGLTQNELHRVDVGSRSYVDQMLREVARRLLGRRAGVEKLEEKPDPTNIAQVIAWRGCAAYLMARTQSTPDQKPGRKPDMSEVAAAAFFAVLDEVANDAEAHPMWKKLTTIVGRKSSGLGKAVGVAAAHAKEAREEVAKKVTSNHKALAADVTNPSTKLNIEGKALTQTELKRVEFSSRAYIDQMLREVVRRLLSHLNEMKLEQKSEPVNAVQVKAYRGCVTYLATRIQSKPEQKPGRKPDMSEAAAAAFLAVLDEVASDGEVDLMWKQFEDILNSKSKGLSKAIGIASRHGEEAREEAARKLISNYKAVANDVANPSPKTNIEGKPLTQTELKRVDADSKPHVERMLREVTRRLVGPTTDMQVEKDVPMDEELVKAYRGCATYLATRTQSKPEQKPGRKPDMSEPAAAVFIAVLDEVAKEAEQRA